MSTSDAESCQRVNPKIQVFCDFYLPGFRAGGPIASISRIVESDATRDYRVVTRNHDLGDETVYPGVKRRSWVPVGRARVLYLHRGLADAWWLIRDTWSWGPDWYYFNSLFSRWGTLLPLLAIRLRILPRADVMIAPRGELSSGALEIKRAKKRVLASAVRVLVGKSVTWHVSTSSEQQDLRAWWGSALPAASRCVVAINPSTAPAAGACSGPQTLTVLYASRIDRKKGLLRAIDIVRRTSNFCSLDFIIAGSISDERYWRMCELALQDLPETVRVSVRGPYGPGEIRSLFDGASVLLLPTQGENFGHVLAEAMSAGCPVIAPDTTPWTEVVRDGGGCVLEDDERAVRYLVGLRKMNEAERFRMREIVLERFSDWYRANQSSVVPFEGVSSRSAQGNS